MFSLLLKNTRQTKIRHIATRALGEKKQVKIQKKDKIRRLLW